jgi:hypothetical protein
MSKKSVFAVFGLAMALVFMNPPNAHAGVAIGVTVGAPVYVRPVYPYPYAVVRPVPRPVYIYPPYAYAGPVYYGRDYDRPYWRQQRWERHEYWEHHRWDRDRDRDRR